MEKKKCSPEQLEELIEFMEGHVDLALGRCKSKEGRALASRLWTVLSLKLNSISTPTSSSRNAKEWAKYYSDYKARLNSKLRSISSSRQLTGGGEGSNIILTPLETRLSALLGYRPDAGPSDLQATRQLPSFEPEFVQHANSSEPIAEGSQMQGEYNSLPLSQMTREDPVNNLMVDHNYLADEMFHEVTAAAVDNGSHIQAQTLQNISIRNRQQQPPQKDNSATLIEMGMQQAQAMQSVAAAIEHIAEAIREVSSLLRAHLNEK